MPFVYQRSSKTRDGADACEVSCKRHACNLQECIARLPTSVGSVMDTSRCTHHMDAWNRCCDNVNLRLKESVAKLASTTETLPP